MKPIPNWLGNTSTASGPLTASADAAATVSSPMRRTPSTGLTVAAYIRARLRAVVMPFAAGISVACTARLLKAKSPSGSTASAPLRVNA